MNSHHFEQMMGWLLKKGPTDPDAIAVAGELAQFLADDPDGDGRDLIKPLLLKMLSDFAPIVWRPFGRAVVQDRTQAWRIEHALGDSWSFGGEKKPPILKVPADILFAWAHANPESAPAFLARVLPVLKTQKVGAEHVFHPLVLRLLNEFGARDDVHRGLVQNMHTFGWSGSLTTYYALYEQPLRSLADHPIGAVRRWAQITLASMRKQIESAKMEDDEQDAEWNA